MPTQLHESLIDMFRARPDRLEERARILGRTDLDLLDTRVRRAVTVDKVDDLRD